jgi:hypothetical protein
LRPNNPNVDAPLIQGPIGREAQIASHLRSALSPWIEVRQPVRLSMCV